MNNMQPSTPGFVLTSLTYRTDDNNNLQQNNRKPAATEQPSSIAKFDYCLPPGELNYFDLPEGEHAA